MAEIVGYCEVCNKQFIKYRSFHKLCSNRCRRIKLERDNYGYVKKKEEKKVCPNCGKEFTDNNKKKVYCCTECAVAYNKEHRIKKEKRTCVCQVCQKEFETTHPTKKYCSSECYKEAKRRRENVS